MQIIFAHLKNSFLWVVDFGIRNRISDSGFRFRVSVSVFYGCPFVAPQAGHSFTDSKISVRISTV